MSKSLILLTVAASIGAQAATLTCVDYGGDPNAPLKEDVTIGKAADLAACPEVGASGYSMYPAEPCIRTCQAAGKYCFNSYKKGADVKAGCAGTACNSGKTADGTMQFCCTTDKCNNNPTALAAWPPATTAAPKSPSTTLSVATLAAAAVGIVAALLM